VFVFLSQLRLLFHGNIHLVTKELKVILPSTFDPYNQVEHLELKLTGVDAQLLTNSECGRGCGSWLGILSQ